MGQTCAFQTYSLEDSEKDVGEPPICDKCISREVFFEAGDYLLFEACTLSSLECIEVTDSIEGCRNGALATVATVSNITKNSASAAMENKKDS